MSNFSEKMKALFESDQPVKDGFVNHLDPDLIQEAMDATGTVMMRRRKLPADQLVWLIVGMGLYANISIHKLVTLMQLSIGGRVVSSAVSQARKRLGFESIKWLFEKLANTWRKDCADSLWKDLSLFGIDGTLIEVPDTQENLDHFGKCRKTMNVAYPHARVLALMDLGQRLLYRAVIAPFAQGESSLARDIVDDLPDGSLCLLDRGFTCRGMLHRIASQGINRHFLVRLKTDTKLEVLETLPDKSAIVQICTATSARDKYPSLPKMIKYRLIVYKIEDKKPIFLLTSLLDWRKYPQGELAELYHKRWEIELAFDELKTHMLHRKEALRSKTPDGVRQELWGLFIAYNLVRREMALVAEEHDANPSQISFVFSLMSIDLFFMQQSIEPVFGILPKVLTRLKDDMWHHRLPRRDGRSNSRMVKLKQSIFPRKPGRPVVLGDIA